MRENWSNSLHEQHRNVTEQEEAYMESSVITQQAETPAQRRRPPWLRPGLFWFAFDLLAPTALIYVLLWLGSGLYAALLASAVVSAVSALVSYRRGTGKQRFASHMLALSMAAFVVALVTGSDRFLLAKESVLTAMVGFWFIGSLWATRPLTYQFTRPLLERRFERKSRSWELLWEREPRFRRIWHVSTVMWGVAMLIDAVLRVVMAYTLPVHDVPAMQTGMIIVTLLVMQILTNTYYVCAGLWRMLHEEPEA
jgi:hypothetical protein